MHGVSTKGPLTLTEMSADHTSLLTHCMTMADLTLCYPLRGSARVEHTNISFSIY